MLEPDGQEALQSGGDREGERLARWAGLVRESTLRRLARVPPGAENQPSGPGVMSFADLARHLVDADDWLARKLAEPELAAMQGSAGSVRVVDRSDWNRLMAELKSSGHRRQKLLRTLDRAALERRLPDERFGGEVEVWWVVVRGNLEHEAHHRGQIAAGLRTLSEEG